MKKLIELDAALEGLENLNAISFYEANEHSKEAYTETKAMLKALPTVDAVQVVHGHWKEDPSGYGFWICSACGFVSEASAANMLYKFCCRRQNRGSHGASFLQALYLFADGMEVNSMTETHDKRTETHACDCISRQAAIDALYHVDEYNGRSVEAIRNLPSAQPEQRWIACSERLPETPGQYYVSGGGKVWICEYHIIPNFIGGWCNDVANPVVQAWMPLPEPYKEGEK